jgi:colanic acid/amylovoran biosynthesis glycosyltransferase
MNDVFIHPSCYSFNKDCEGGAPVVLLNAQYRGLPVLSTRHCDIPEEVIHGKTGILSEEKNIDQLTDGILKFIEMNQGTYSEFSIEAQNHVKNVYNIDDTGDQLQKLYFSKLE